MSDRPGPEGGETPRKRHRILVYGYGNPGREDDGAGPYLAGLFEEAGLLGVDTDADYQLQIEDAVAISEYDLTGSGSTTSFVSYQALHAWRIRFCHPITEREMEIEAPFHGPFKQLVELLRRSRSV